MATNKVYICGLPGFGFPGEKGEEGNPGPSIRFRTVRSYVSVDDIPVIKDEETIWYVDRVSGQGNGADPITEGDTVILCGTGGVKTVPVRKDTTGSLYLDMDSVKSEMNLSEIPEYTFGVTYARLASSQNTIKLYPTLDSNGYSAMKVTYAREMSDGSGPVDEYRIKDFGGGFTNTDNIDIQNVKTLHFYIYYKVSAYRYVKAYAFTMNINY